MAEVKMPTTNTSQPERKPLSPIVTGGVKKPPKTLGQKFKETFIAEDVKTVKKHLIGDILVPEIKKTVSDLATNAVQSILGTSGHTRPTQQNNSIFRTNYIGYSAMSTASQKPAASPQKQTIDIENQWNEIVIPSKEQASEVIQQLCDIIEQYQQTSLLDLYELVGLSTRPTDYNYGWTDLSNATVKPIAGGYWLCLPKPVPLSK